MNLNLASESTLELAAAPALTRKALKIQEAIESGQNLEAVIARENAIEEAEQRYKQEIYKSSLALGA